MHTYIRMYLKYLHTYILNIRTCIHTYVMHLTYLHGHVRVEEYVEEEHHTEHAQSRHQDT